MTASPDLSAGRTRAGRAEYGFLCAAGLLLALACTVVLTGGRPLLLDGSMHHWALVHRPPWGVEAARLVTDSGTGAVALLLAAVAGAALARVRGVLLAVAVLLSGQAVRAGVAEAIGRARPPHADWAVQAGWPAFPSGHTTSATIVAVLLAAAFPWPWARALAALWAVAVGCTRVVLGVHWPSDVAGGWLMGFVWATAALLLWRRSSR